MKILECSSRGDKRFSAFYARVKFLNVWDSIENHYQRAKYFHNTADTANPKGKRPDGVVLNEQLFSVELLTPLYKYLWLKYLDMNHDLVEYARNFDDFNDMFKGKSINCQADVIRQYIKEGRMSVQNDASPIFKALATAQRPGKGYVSKYEQEKENKT